MGRSTSGVIGMKFRADDELLTMARITAQHAGDTFVFTATDGGYGKKTPLDEYRLQGRGGIGIKAAKIDENSRGSLVSALVLRNEDEILAITSGGTVMRTPAAEVRQTGRDSMGVRLVNLDDGARVLVHALHQQLFLLRPNSNTHVFGHRLFPVVQHDGLFVPKRQLRCVLQSGVTGHPF
jgi:DNA gyrase subunit A